MLPLAQSRPAASDLLCAPGRGFCSPQHWYSPQPRAAFALSWLCTRSAPLGDGTRLPQTQKKREVSLALEENPREQVPQVPGTCCVLQLLPLPYERSANVVGTGQGFPNTPCPEGWLQRHRVGAPGPSWPSQPPLGAAEPPTLLGTGLALLWVCKARNPFTDGCALLHPCRTAVPPWRNDAAPRAPGRSL